MRLAQLARKIKVQPQEIIDFIQHEYEDLTIHKPNALIPDEYVVELLRRFNVESNPIKVESPSKLDLENNPETEKTNANENGEVELIKAPKVKLEGIKVVGKIELPQKNTVNEEEVTENKKESDAAEETTEARLEKERSADIKQQKPPKRSQHKQQKNKVISFEEQKRREQQAYKKEKQNKIASEKRKKKAHYEQMMQERNTKKQTRSLKQKTSTKENATSNVNAPQKEKEAPQKEAPKTTWQKIIYWFNH